jgi:hypothetical protein
VDEVRTELNKCIFLKVGLNEDEVNFVSEGHRKYAESALAGLRRKAIQLQIDYLRLNPSSGASRFIPNYLEQLGESEALVNQLSPDHFRTLLSETSSTIAMKAQAELGLSRSAELRKFTEVLRFAYQRSVFLALAQSDELPSEVGALVALGKSESAMKIASLAASNEARLSLLAAYARQAKSVSGMIESSVIDYIKELVGKLDLGQLGERVGQLATDLMFLDADLAIGIVENSIVADRSEDWRDLAYAKMSLVASLSDASDQRKIEEQLRRKIKDERLQEAILSVASIFARSTADRIIKVTEEMEPKRKVAFLRRVVAFNPGRDRVLDLVDLALEALVADSAYSPKASDLADLARPLSFVDGDHDRVLRIARRIEAQIGLIAARSQLRDIVALQMRIARVESRFDLSSAGERIAQLYIIVASDPSPEAKAEGFALMLRFLNGFKGVDDLEERHGFREVARSELEKILEEILRDTADHFVVVKGALEALASFDPASALALCAKLNTRINRNKAFALAAETFCTRRYSEEFLVGVQACLNSVSDTEKRDQMIHSCIVALKRNPEPRAWLQALGRLSQIIKCPIMSCEAAIALCEIAESFDRGEAHGRLVSTVRACGESSDSSLCMADIYFRSARIIAQTDLSTAKQLYDAGAQQRARSKSAGSESSKILCFSVALLIRASVNMLKHKIFSRDHLMRLSNIIEKIPCKQRQASYYSELSVWAWCVGNVDYCREICSSFIQPLLQLDEICSPESLPIHRSTFPAQYLAHSATAFQRLRAIPIVHRSECLARTVSVVMYHVPTTEPISKLDFKNFQNVIENVHDALSLIEQIETDQHLYHSIDVLVTAVLSEKNKTRFTAQQKASIREKLLEIIDRRIRPTATILPRDVERRQGLSRGLG